MSQRIFSRQRTDQQETWTILVSTRTFSGISQTTRMLVNYAPCQSRSGKLSVCTVYLPSVKYKLSRLLYWMRDSWYLLIFGDVSGSSSSSSSAILSNQRWNYQKRGDKTYFVWTETNYPPCWELIGLRRRSNLYYIYSGTASNASASVRQLSLSSVFKSTIRFRIHHA